MSASVVSSGTSAEGAGVYSLKWNHYQTSMTAGLVDLLEDPEYSMTDVTLACEGQFIQAHKIVLAVSSPFFKQFFKMNRLERSGTTLIALANVEFKDLQSVIRFIYNGEVHLRNAEVRSFLETAKMLQVQGLTNESPKMGESNQGSKIKTPKSSTSAQEKHPATSVPVPSKSCPPAKRFRPASISNPQIVQDEELSVSQDHSMSIAPASRMLFTSMHNEAEEEEEELISIDVKPEAIVCPTSTDFFYDEDVGEDMDNMSEPFDQSTNDYDIGFPNLIASQNSQVDFTANVPGPSAGRGKQSNTISIWKSGDLGRCAFCPKVPGRQKRSSRKRCESCKHFVCAQDTCRRSLKIQEGDGGSRVVILCIGCNEERSNR